MSSEIIRKWEETLGADVSTLVVDPDATIAPSGEPGSAGGGATARPTTDTSAPAPGQQIEASHPARFSVTRELGRGGMGVVLRARQSALGRDVALKIMRRDLARRIDEFEGEARLTGYLDHPNIVPVHDLASTAEGEGFLVMKCVEGTTWKSALATERAAHDGAIDLERHLTILESVCQAIAFAHSRGIVHRDLKPENVMIGAFGEVQVMDWGLAVEVRPTGRAPRASAVTRPAGTPAYMAPELARGEGAQIGPATDVYLLGAILHELVTGRAPHRGSTLLELIDNALASRPPVFAPDVPERLARIATRCLAREPGDRFPDVSALIGELARYRRHREAEALVRIGQTHLNAAASASGRSASYAALSDAITAFRQAATLDAESAQARSGERAARLLLARAALDVDDLGLTQSQIAALDPCDEETCELSTRLTLRRQEVEARARVARRMRWALAAAVAVVAAGLLVGFLVVRGERDRARLAESGERDARREAETRRDDAQRQRRKAEEESLEAMISTGFAHASAGQGAAARERFARARQGAQRLGVDIPHVVVGEWHSLAGSPAPLLSLPTPPGGGIACALSPDGSRGAVLGADGTLLVNETLTGRTLMHVALPPNKDPANFHWYVAFDATGHKIGISTGLGAVLVDVASGRWSKAPVVGKSVKQVIAVGSQLLAAVVSRPSPAHEWDWPGEVVELVDLATGQVVARQSVARGSFQTWLDFHFPGSGPPEVLAVTPFHVELESSRRGRKIGPDPRSGQRCAVFGPTGRDIAAGLDNGEVEMYRDGSARSWAARAHSGQVRWIAFAGPETLVSASSAEANILDVATGRSCGKLQPTSGPLVCLAVQEPWVLTCTPQRTELWSLRERAAIRSWPVPLRSHTMSGLVQRIEFTRDSQQLISFGDLRDVEIFDVATGILLGRWNSHHEEFKAALQAIPPSADSGPPGRHRSSWPGPESVPVLACRGRRRLERPRDQSLVIRDALTERTVGTLTASAEELTRLMPLPGDRYAVWGVWGLGLRVVDLERAMPVAVLPFHEPAPILVAMAPDGSRLVMMARDHRARVIDLSFPQQRARMSPLVEAARVRLADSPADGPALAQLAEWYLLHGIEPAALELHGRAQRAGAGLSAIALARIHWARALKILDPYGRDQFGLRLSPGGREAEADLTRAVTELERARIAGAPGAAHLDACRRAVAELLDATRKGLAGSRRAR